MKGREAIALRRDVLIERSRVVLSQDSRVLAAWLEGSLADGTADAYSDVDLHLLIRDDARQEVWAERHVFIERLGRILMAADFLAGPDTVGCLLKGPIKVDVTFESESDFATKKRTAAEPLLGSSEIYSKLRVGWEPSDDEVRLALDALVRNTFQGATWPVRLLGRKQWSTFLHVEFLLIETAIAPLMLVQHDRRTFHRNPFGRSRNLTVEQRKTVSRLTEQVLFAARDEDRQSVLAAHLAILHQICEEAKRAFDLYELSFPEQIEDELTAFYQREWPA